MPTTTYVQRLTNLLPIDGLSGESDPELLERFIRATARQIRAPYQAKFNDRTVIEQLTEMFESIQVRTGTDPIVRGEPLDGGIAVVTVMPDQPFIVDTVRLLLRNAGANHTSGINAVVSIGRNEDGEIVRVDDPDDPGESFVRAEAEGLSADQLPSIVARLEGHLRLAQHMVEDFPAITDVIEQAAYSFARKADRIPDRADDMRETAAFLRWLLADNFVLMGAQAGDKQLGFARAPADLWDTTKLDKGWDNEAATGGVKVRKGVLESPVHRAGRVDEIQIEVPGSGKTTTPLLLQGLFTYRAVTQPSRHVPVLRRSLARILSQQDSKPGSFRYKGTANVFDSLPTEFLFTTPTDEIARMIERVLDAEHEHRSNTHVTQSPSGDLTFVLAAIPKSCWSDRLRVDIEELLVGATGASYSDHGVFVGRYDMMLVHFYLTGTRLLTGPDTQSIRDRVTEMSTTWEDRLMGALVDSVGQRRADELVTRYGEAFDESYTTNARTAQTITDLELLDELTEVNPLVADMLVDEQNRINLRIYHIHEILLSDVLPVLDNFGLIIIDQFSDIVRARDDMNRIIDTFRLQGVWGVDPSEVMARKEILVEALEAVFSKLVADDLLNRILLRADIPWKAVDMIRAYVGYARQLGLHFTQARIQEILLAQPELVRMLWDYFQTCFDPEFEGQREKAIEKKREAFDDLVRGVPNHDQDITFRTLFNLVEATQRTNFYRTDKRGHYLSFKIDCSRVKNMPSPRLMYEIYVHHRDMEGVHLRGGPIARGGIRWSDREDYRREILDLATTQMVKNVLIVPEGAKGGFFIKHPIPEASERRRKADSLYRTFMKGLLDITDNIIGGKVVHPPHTVVFEGEDPYLVVAADKGTAHLSDTANSVAGSYNFWLGDAFASGGSNGYDHKKVGITARGTWMTVRRHFQEMGVNPDEDIFTCVGIGDPGGDVFGNGVIETPKMKLLAAFNHLHVFIDPDPDPDKSYEERMRLFREVKGWDQYNTELISAGGGIYDRRAKSIPLSPEVKELLGVLQDELPVDAVIRLILRLNVDLLWNGGIGTYVKATHETHLEAGDPTNDALRVNAGELRCRMIGEGGNLGFTQAARLEYALAGGRCNTDAIDNSGGVDMSDHEVNLKILLRPIVSRGDITMDQRNELLEKWTDEVAQMVLANNDNHARQISLDQIRTTRDPMSFSPIIDFATRMSARSRAELQLPTDEVLRRRTTSRQGITRPELAVLSGHIKMAVFKAMMADTEHVIDNFDQWVVHYFPKEVQERFGKDITEHMLHRAIGMTMVLNHVMGDVGVEFFPLLQQLTAATPVQLANTWLRIGELCNLEQLRRQLNATEASLEHRYRAWTDVTRGMGALTALWLSPGEAPPSDDDIERFKQVLSKMPRIWGTPTEELYRGRIDKYQRRKIPAHLAHKVGSFGQLTMAWEIARLHAEQPKGARLSQSIIKYISVGEASRILPALRSIEGRSCEGPWDPVAMGILRYRYAVLLRDLVRVVDAGPHVRLGVDRLSQKLGRGPLKALQTDIDRILGQQPDLATLLVAQEQVRALVASQPTLSTADEAPSPRKRSKNKKSTATRARAK